MGDPHAYITPDVVADFTTIHLDADGEDRVRVFGIKGAPATDKLKVSIAYRAGFKAVGTLVYAWPDALEKAQLADRVLRERLDKLGLTFDQILTEFVGVDRDARPARRRCPTSCPKCSCASACAATTARPSSASRARSRRSCSTARRASPASPAAARRSRRSSPTGRRSSTRRVVQTERGGAHRMKVRLLDIAHARSGDKGDTANVGVIALRNEWYPILVRYVTRERVAEHFAGVIKGAVERFELPNLNALNFLLHGALDGGGTLSLKTDAQGKVFSTAMLRMVIDVPDAEARAARACRSTGA